MGITKDIHQTKFRNEKNQAMVNLLFTNNWMMGKIKNFVNQEGITPQQYNILRILRGADMPLSTLHIRERMLDKMSDTSRVVERLLAKGFVVKKISEKDKRKVDVVISDKGRKVLEKLDARNNELDGIFKNLTKEEALHLSQLLDKLRTHQ